MSKHDRLESPFYGYASIRLHGDRGARKHHLFWTRYLERVTIRQIFKYPPHKKRIKTFWFNNGKLLVQTLDSSRYAYASSRPIVDQDGRKHNINLSFSKSNKQLFSCFNRKKSRSKNIVSATKI